jgi:hypothetical protein
VTTPFNFWLARDKPSIPLFHPAASQNIPSSQQLHSTRRPDDNTYRPFHTPPQQRASSRHLRHPKQQLPASAGAQTPICNRSSLEIDGEITRHGFTTHTRTIARQNRWSLWQWCSRHACRAQCHRQARRGHHVHDTEDAFCHHWFSHDLTTRYVASPLFLAITRHSRAPTDILSQ